MRQFLIGGGLAILAVMTYHRMTGQADGPLASLLTIVFSFLALLMFIASAVIPAPPPVQRQRSPLVRIAVGLGVLAVLLGFLIVVVVAGHLAREARGLVTAFRRPPLDVPMPTPRLPFSVAPSPAPRPALPPAASPQPANPSPRPLAKPQYVPPAEQPGEPTELIGGPEGWQFQAVDKDRRPVLGFRYAMGDWAGQPAVAELTPLFERGAHAGGAALEYGREGYIVGGLNIAADDLVNAVQVVYVRQQPDGTLNKDDSYVSGWIGSPGSRPIQSIGDREARVIGICGRHGAVKNALALVVDRSPPAVEAPAATAAVAGTAIPGAGPRERKPAAPSPPAAKKLPVYKPPPKLPGQPTELAGGPEGWQFELFDNSRRPVVGFRHRMGSWAGQPAVAQLDPLYDRQPPSGPLAHTIARDDYVVGGLHVVSGDLVNAVRIIFVRQKTNGSLDKSDFYLSDWIGNPADKEPTVLGDGKTKVIGVCGRHGAVLNAIALVLDKT